MSNKDPFLELSWDDLEDWAGNRVVSRGNKLQKSGNVAALWKLDAGRIIAQVRGGSLYVTKVTCGEDALKSVCTCPYGWECKHAVAAVIKYLDNSKESRKIPQLPDDQRESLLAELAVQLEKDGATLKEFLQSKSRNELVSFCLELADGIPQLRKKLLDKQAVANGKSNEVLKSIRNEIASMGNIEWDQYGHTSGEADLDRLQDQLRALVEMAAFDELVELEPELLRGGSETVQYEHESESMYAIQECLEIVIDALPHSSLLPEKRIVWVIDMALEDEYGLCDAIDPDRIYDLGGKRDWSAVADEFLNRLAKQPKPGPGESSYSNRYARDQISNWAIVALENAGRKKEMLDVYVSEARTNRSWARLVEHLFSLKQWDQAKDFCIEGIKSLGKSPG